MKIAEIYKNLDEICPFASQEPWDNSGLQVGSFDSEFERIYLSLDLDSELLQNVLPNSLIITHHPLIFKGLKSLDYSLYPSSLIREMMIKNISLISLHTNADLAFLNEKFVTQVLGLEISSKEGFLIYADVKTKFSELCKFVKEKLGLEISKICICTGSGADLMQDVKADAFLTGDLKYHQALYAKENGLNLIDINHYESERYFSDFLAKYLQNLKIEVIISNSKNPFTYC